MDDRLRIGVLTGDPRLPDPTKRDHRYNEEDFATDRAMREAFISLPGYAFEFLNDHAQLFERFAADRPDLVVNFCDTACQRPAQDRTSRRCSKCSACRTAAPRRVHGDRYDKQSCVWLPTALGVPVPREICLEPDQELPARPDLYPALIKPNQGTAASASPRTRGALAAEAERYVAWLRRELPGRALLLQEYLPGPEHGVGLIGTLAANSGAPGASRSTSPGRPPALPRSCPSNQTLPDSPDWTEIRFRRAEADDAAPARMLGQRQTTVRAARLPRPRPASTSAAPPTASPGRSRSTPTRPGPTTASSRPWPASPASPTPTC